MPPKIPAKDFWSVVVHDPQTRSILQTDQRFPSTNLQRQGIISKPDTSVDAYFGPQPPPGKEANWIQANSGKAWMVILRASAALSRGSTRPGGLRRLSFSDERAKTREGGNMDAIDATSCPEDDSGRR